MQQDDARGGKRVEILGDLRGEITVFQPLTVKELSREGCLVETAFPLQLNSLHDVRLSVGDRSIVAKGRVAHCRIIDVNQDIVSYQAGMEFIELSNHVRDAIRSFMDTLEAIRNPEA